MKNLFVIKRFIYYNYIDMQQVFKESIINLPSISLSLLLSKRFNTGRAVLTTLNGGGGFLLRHKFDRVQTMLRVNVT